jgi:hypothetical protein
VEKSTKPNLGMSNRLSKNGPMSHFAPFGQQALAVFFQIATHNTFSFL